MYLKNKKLVAFFLAIGVLATGCGGKNEESVPEKITLAPEDVTEYNHIIVDSFGNESFVEKNAKVVALDGSFAKCWNMAGGTVVGATSEIAANSDYGMNKDVEIVGTNEIPDATAIISMKPDFVIMNAKNEVHKGLENDLKEAQIAYGYFEITSYKEFCDVFKMFTQANENTNIYEQLAKSQEETINKLIGDAKEKEADSTVIALEVDYDSVYVVSEDSYISNILMDFGFENPSKDKQELCEKISLDEINELKPDVVLVRLLGNPEESKSIFELNFSHKDDWGDYKLLYLPEISFKDNPLEKFSECYQYIYFNLFAEG